MKARISKLLFFSNHFKTLAHFTETSISKNPSATAPLPQLLLPSLLKTHYSSVPNRSMRGERRKERSEDHFLRNLNFGDDGDDDEKTKKSPQNSPSRIPNRPLRGEKRLGNLFSGDDEDDEKMIRTGQRPPSRIPNRPMRRERREDGTFLQNSNIGSEYSGGKFGSSQRNSPVDLADGPLGGEDTADRSGDISIRNLKLRDMSERPISGEKRGDQSEGSLLQKLKFGKKEEEKTHQSPSTQTPETDSVLSESSSQDADEIFRKMKETGLIPNAVAMLDGLCKDGLIQEAMKLFGLMREKGTIPEVVVYTAVVEGFCKAAKFDDAKRIFRKMQNNNISPNAFSYMVLIQGLSKGNRLENSVEFCLEMLDAGHSPNVVTFTDLVDRFCRDKGVEEAESVIRSLRERGLAVDDKAVREHLDKKGPFSPMVWEAIFGKKCSQRPF